MSVRGAASCWLAAGVVYPTLEFIAARAIPDYRYSRDFVSDLGRPDSPLSLLMNTAFVVQGSLFLAGSILLVRNASDRETRPLLALAGLNAVGNVVVASVPSGPTGVAGLHVTGAVLAIVGGNAAVVAGSRLVFGDDASPVSRCASVGVGVLGLLSFGALAVDTVTGSTIVLPAAVWERLSVYTITGWELVVAIALLTGRRTAPR